MLQPRLFDPPRSAGPRRPDGPWIDPVVECADNRDFLAALEPGSVHLVVTSPPYGVGKAYEGPVPLADYLEAQRRVIRACLRVLAPGGSICWQVGNRVEAGGVVPLDAVLFPVFSSLGLVLRNRIVWHFGHGLHCRRRFSGRYETILWWTRPGPYTWHLDPVRVPSKYPGKRFFKGPRKGEIAGHPLGKNPSDHWTCDFRHGGPDQLWDVPNVKHNHPEKTAHPCQYPVELVERLVLSLTDPGGRVLDPYLGAGSAVLAAAKQHRAGLGCDLDPAYVEIARRRVALLAAGTLATRPMERRVPEPSGRTAWPRPPSV